MDDWSEAHHRKPRQKDSQWPGMEHDLKLDWNLTLNATAKMIGSMVDCQCHCIQDWDWWARRMLETTRSNHAANHSSSRIWNQGTDHCF